VPFFCAVIGWGRAAFLDIYPKKEETIIMGDTKKQKKNSKVNGYGYLHDFGKLFIDLAKLAFGSLVLGTIIRWDIPKATTFIMGIAFSAVVGTVGIILAREFKEK
jgi:hypothetical protein